jgi:hypothetical protein
VAGGKSFLKSRTGAPIPSRVESRWAEPADTSALVMFIDIFY